MRYGKTTCEMNLIHGKDKSPWEQWILAFAASSAMVGIAVDNGWSISMPFTSNEKLRLFEESTLVIIGAIIGALAADIFGRRRTLLFASIFVIPRLAVLWVTTESAYWMSIYLASIGWGITSVVVPLYISEIASNHNRGNLMVMQLSVYMLGILVSCVVATISRLLDADETTEFAIFRVLLAISILFQMKTLWDHPETPCYLNWGANVGGTVQSCAVFSVVEHVNWGRGPESLSKNSNVENTRRIGRGKIGEILRFENLRNLAIILSLIVIRRTVGQERNMGVWMSLATNSSSETNTWFKIFISIGFRSIAGLFISVILMFKIRMIERKSSLLVVILLCLTAAVIGAISQRYSWIIIASLSVQEIGHLIFIAVTLAYVGEFFPIKIRAMVIAAITTWEVTVRFIVSVIDDLLKDPEFWEEEYLTKHFFINCTTLFIAVFFVLIFFPATIKLPQVTRF